MSDLRPAEDGTGDDTGEQWDLVVYVTDASPTGQRAIANLRRACEAHLAGRYTIEVVDVLADPGRAAADLILASPTVVRRLPKPIRKLVGDLSDSDRLILALELPSRGSAAAASRRAVPAGHAGELPVAGVPSGTGPAGPAGAGDPVARRARQRRGAPAVVRTDVDRPAAEPVHAIYPPGRPAGTREEEPGTVDRHGRPGDPLPDDGARPRRRHRWVDPHDPVQPAA
jgi:circadian clock protein KaiB